MACCSHRTFIKIDMKIRKCISAQVNKQTQKHKKTNSLNYDKMMIRTIFL